MTSIQGARNVGWPIALAVLILVASGRKAVATPFFIPHSDKIIHFFIFGLLATLVIRLHPVWTMPRARGWLAIGVVSLFGIVDEFRQSFTPGRYVEFADWMADTFGAAVAVWAYLFWKAYRSLLEKPLWGRTASLASRDRNSR